MLFTPLALWHLVVETKLIHRIDEPYKHCIKEKHCISQSIRTIQNLLKIFIFRIYIETSGISALILLTQNVIKSQKTNPIIPW